jgi:hypothetical protein
LQTGLLCERGHEQGHTHHSTPAHSHQHDHAPCPLMASCAPATAATPARELFTPALVATAAPIVRALALHSVSAAPEPPPPKA